MQLTVEGVPDDTDLDKSQTLSTINEDFGDSDIEFALDDIHRFLQDTSYSIKSPLAGTNNSMNTELEPKAFTPVSISPTFNRSDRHKLPNKEQDTDNSQVTSEYGNRYILQHKRKLFPGLKLHSTLHTRNLRPRLKKGKSGNQASYNDNILEDDNENSLSEGVLVGLVAKNNTDLSATYPKTSVPSTSDKDK